MRRFLWVVLGVVLWVGCAGRGGGEPVPYCEATRALCGRIDGVAQDAFCVSPDADFSACDGGDADVCIDYAASGLIYMSSCIDESTVAEDPVCPDGWSVRCHVRDYD